MSETSKKALIALLGIIIVIGAYMYVISPAIEDIDKLNSDITTLQARLNELTEKEKQKDQLLAETAEFNQKFEEILKDYPADLNQESTVMFFKSIEENNEFVLKTFSMPKEAQFYKLGSSSTVSNDALTGQDIAPEDTYICTTSAYGISYEGSYQGIKDVLTYVADYRYRMNSSTMNITYNEAEDLYTGSITINAYAISGPDRTPDKVDPGLPAGTDNLFFRGDGSGGASSSGSSKYDADDGAAIVTSNNLVLLLNSANSDLSSGIIAASNSNREETYVTSNENDRVALDLSVYTEEGKNFLKYSIGDASYTVELLTEDVTIYVKSSARVDADDKNGVDVSVMNTSTLKVYFKVVDDDATSPRFKVVNKSGTVKVY